MNAVGFWATRRQKRKVQANDHSESKKRHPGFVCPTKDLSTPINLQPQQPWDYSVSKCVFNASKPHYKEDDDEKQDIVFGFFFFSKCLGFPLSDNFWIRGCPVFSNVFILLLCYLQHGPLPTPQAGFTDNICHPTHKESYSKGSHSFFHLLLLPGFECSHTPFILSQDFTFSPFSHASFTSLLLFMYFSLSAMLNFPFSSFNFLQCFVLVMPGSSFQTERGNSSSQSQPFRDIKSGGIWDILVRGREERYANETRRVASRCADSPKRKLCFLF